MANQQTLKTESDDESASLNPLVLLDVGTRITFLKTLTEAADSESPAIIYARKGDAGVVTGHGCPEGHYVKWSGWPSQRFGAILGEEFEKENAKVRDCPE